MSKESKASEESKQAEAKRDSETEALTAQLIDHMRGEVLARRMIEEVRRENAALAERCGELETLLSETLAERKDTRKEDDDGAS